MTTDDVLKELYNTVEIKKSTYQNFTNGGVTLSSTIANAKVEAYEDVLTSIRALLSG